MSASMKNITKNIFLNAITCPTLGWLMRTGADVKQTLTLGEILRIEQGNEVGQRARGLYPEGILVKNIDLVAASKETWELISDPCVSVIFEGTFLVDGYVAKTDILKRSDDGWHMIEVKSSVNDKEEFIDDMAYSLMVLDKAGLKISKVSLLLISKAFRLGTSPENLFVEIDHTDRVIKRTEVFKSIWKQIDEITGSSDKPDPAICYECRDCDHSGECVLKGIDSPIFDLPRLNQSKFEKFKKLNILDITDIPDDFPLTEHHKIVRESVLTKKTFIGSDLKNELDSISWPASYLDFETLMTAIPLYPGIAPFTQIPVLYSIHKCGKPGNVIGHQDYLADYRKDSRRELAENLIRDLQGEGSIIVYSNFERTIINQLCVICPDLFVPLNLLLERMIDLEVIIRKNFYHPDFHGSTSIKRTLPVLVPAITYEGMEIGDGDSAMAAFAYLALGKYNEEESTDVINNLVIYCGQDTLAMVKLHEKLVENVGGG